MEDIKPSFTKTMRAHTRKIHTISDMMINAKMVFALQDNKIWAEGLLVFYEIFRFLENNVEPHILPENYHRTQAFEQDLAFYLGNDWKKTYVIRPSVGNYINHLQQLKNTNPILLLAFVYHMYMGLLSGGQILGKKKQMGEYFSKTTTNNEGLAVTTYENDTIADLKREMRAKTDAIAETLDEKTKDLLLQESIKVFELNNELVRTIEGTSQILWRQIGVVLLVLLTVYFFFKLWKI